MSSTRLNGKISVCYRKRSDLYRGKLSINVMTNKCRDLVVVRNHQSRTNGERKVQYIVFTFFFFFLFD